MDTAFASKVSRLARELAELCSLAKALRSMPKSDIWVSRSVWRDVRRASSGALLISTSCLIRDAESIPEPPPSELMMLEPGLVVLELVLSTMKLSSRGEIIIRRHLLCLYR